MAKQAIVSSKRAPRSGRVTALELPLELELSAGGAGLHRYFVVDVFTDTPLEGNQLGVFADGRAFTDEQMQRLARELNVAETIFVLPPEQGGDVRIRIFTPASELPFAGHPVLGASFVVGGALALDEVRLETGPRDRPAAAGALGRTRRVRLDGAARRLLAAVRACGRAARRARRRALAPPGRGVRERAAARLRPARERGGGRGVAARPRGARRRMPRVGANCFAGSGARWKTRMFAPSLGDAEDPATGSAAGPLAIHLGRHGVVPFGERIEIRQGVEILRPSLLHARAHGTAERIERVEVGGSAVIVARGEYRI